MSDTPKIRLAGQDSKGDFFDAQSVNEYAAHNIAKGNGMPKRASQLSESTFGAAESICNEAYAAFNISLNRLIEAERKIAEQSRKVGQQVRISANEMGEGLRRIEKTADFNKLERYVVLLERAAAAMSTLAELEKNGKLGRISAALK